MGRIGRVVVAAALWAGACGGDGEAGDAFGDDSADAAVPDSGPGTAAIEMIPEGSRQLSLESEGELRLGYEATARIDVRLTDREGQPVSDARVGFALMGRPEDASLEQLDVRTDDDGRASNVLMAGSTLATFRVRITAAGAEEKLVQASVSNAGFGSLLVDATYTGRRLVNQRIVTVLTNMMCSQARRMAGDPMALLDAAEVEPVRFGALPAGASYAVVAVGQGADETVVAVGCADSVEIEADRERAVTVRLVDEPLQPRGRFAWTAEFSTEVPARTLVSAFERAATNLVDAQDVSDQSAEHAAGHFWLDSLESAFRSDEYESTAIAAFAEVFAAAREEAALGDSGDSFEASLSAALEAEEHGPMQAAARMAELSEATLDHLHASGELELQPGDDADEVLLGVPEDGELFPGPPAEEAANEQPEPSIWVRLDRLESGAPRQGSGRLVVDLTAFSEETADALPVQSPGATTVEAQFDAEDDSLSVLEMQLPAPLGTLATQVLNRIAGEGDAGYRAELRERLGCAEVQSWLRSLPLDSSSCDDSCMAYACDRALTRIVGAGEGVLRPFDESRSAMTLSGRFVLIDDNGDLLAESLSCESLSGTWGPRGEEPSELSGSLEGTAIVE